MKVLLISPRDAYNKSNITFLMGGENTFTRTLLLNPPKGVKYIFYADALRKKYITYSFWHKPLAILQKLRILPLGPSIMCFSIKKKFDLIHVHAYGAKLSGLRIPVVLSDSSSNYLFLRDYAKWTKSRIYIGYALKKIVFKLFSIYDQLLNRQKAPLIVWSEFAKKHHEAYSHDNEKITVIPPGISTRASKRTMQTSCNILFIGTNFRRKGGLLLVKAYTYLKEKYRETSLKLISDVPKNLQLPKDTYHKSYITRDELIRSIYPKADILVLVPPVAEGYGLVVLEAASFGIPSVVSSVYALPEIVEDGKTGFVIRPGSVEDLIGALEKLITNKALREKMGRAARGRFLEKFSIEVTNKRLLEVYNKTMQRY